MPRWAPPEAQRRRPPNGPGKRERTPPHSARRLQATHSPPHAGLLHARVAPQAAAPPRGAATPTVEQPSAASPLPQAPPKHSQPFSLGRQLGAHPSWQLRCGMRGRHSACEQLGRRASPTLAHHLSAGGAASCEGMPRLAVPPSVTPQHSTALVLVLLGRRPPAPPPRLLFSAARQSGCRLGKGTQEVTVQAIASRPRWHGSQLGAHKGRQAAHAHSAPCAVQGTKQRKHPNP